MSTRIPRSAAALSFAALAMIARPARPDAVADEIFGPYRFAVDFGSVAQGTFKAASGIDAEIEVAALPDGSERIVLRRKPGIGHADGGLLALSTGLDVGAELKTWLKQVKSGNASKKEVTVELHGRKNDAICRWTFGNSTLQSITAGKIKDKPTTDVTLKFEKLSTTCEIKPPRG